MLPILMTFVALFLVFGPFMEEILVEYLYSIAVLVFFFILYFPFVLKKYKLPGMGERRTSSKLGQTAKLSVLLTKFRFAFPFPYFAFRFLHNFGAAVFPSGAPNEQRQLNCCT